jgi:hypothetical protein
MGPTNHSKDMVPPGPMYAAARLVGGLAWWNGAAEWEFTEMLETPPPAKEFSRFQKLVKAYLWPIITKDHWREGPVGWKLPETLLTLPWLVQYKPNIHYIYWVRDPLDVILGPHVTDDLRKFGVQYWRTGNALLDRALSWKYQYDLVKSTPKPSHWLELRFEDYVLKQKETLERLEEFLGMKMVRLPVKYEAVGRWKKSGRGLGPELLDEARREMGYVHDTR